MNTGFLATGVMSTSHCNERYTFDMLKLQTWKLKINNLFELESWYTPAYMHKLFRVNSRAARSSVPLKPTVGFENFHFQN